MMEMRSSAADEGSKCNFEISSDSYSNMRCAVLRTLEVTYLWWLSWSNTYPSFQRVLFFKE